MDETPTRASPSSLDTVRARPGGRSARIRIRVLSAVREELLQVGYGGLSHRAVAARARVDPATIYRRWPTRSRLVVDSLLEVASASVPVPDTGSIASDLEAFLDSLVVALSDPTMLTLLHALSAASAEADADLSETVTRFWHVRFGLARAMIARAVERRELPPGVDPDATIEQLVSPAYFRALVLGKGFDAGFSRRCAAGTLAAAAAPEVR